MGALVAELDTEGESMGGRPERLVYVALGQAVLDSYMDFGIEMVGTSVNAREEQAPT
jgi:hypothetical protein